MTLPSFSVVTEKQNISSSIAMHISWGGDISASLLRGSFCCSGFGLVDLKPFLVRVMWPFAVAVEGGRYFLISAADIPGRVNNSVG